MMQRDSAAAGAGVRDGAGALDCRGLEARTDVRGKRLWVGKLCYSSLVGV